MSLRTTFCAVVFVTGLVGAGFSCDVAAQTIAGPLGQAESSAAMRTPPTKKTHPARIKTAQTKNKAERVKPAPLEPWAAVDPGRVAPTPPPEAAAPPLDTKASASEDARPSTRPDLAMKWNGNNDTTTQTRAQNYGGDAEGAGAAMGLKFHF